MAVCVSVAGNRWISLCGSVRLGSCDLCVGLDHSCTQPNTGLGRVVFIVMALLLDAETVFVFTMMGK